MYISAHRTTVTIHHQNGKKLSDIEPDMTKRTTPFNPNASHPFNIGKRAKQQSA